MPSLRSELDNELNENIAIKEGERVVTLSKRRALVRSLLDAALAGDLRAASAVIALARTADDERHDADDGAIQASDAELLEKYVADQIRRRSESKEPSS